MRHLALIGALWMLAAFSVHAQIQIAAQTERSTFLLYERIDLLVSITNTSDTDLILNNDEGQPWLSFVVTRHVDHNYVPVKTEKDSSFAPLTLKPGESQTLRVNLIPIFSIRAIGDYTASAVISLPGTNAVSSENVLFSVLPGHKVWTQVRPIDGSQRIYSLIRFSYETKSTRLYLRVEDPDKNIVYTNIGIGDIAAFIEPEAFFDPQGNLHILNPFAAGRYLYTRTDSTGKILHQGIFRTFQENPPRLRKIEDGNVVIVGGVEENPSTPHEQLSIGQRPSITANKPAVQPPNTTADIPGSIP